MMNDEERTTVDSTESAPGEPEEQNDEKAQETQYEQTKKLFLSFENWEEIAEVETLRLFLKATNLSQTDKEYLLSILSEKSKKLKMHTEFKKIVSAVKKEIAKDRDYLRSTYNFINFYETPLPLASRNFSCDESNIYHGNELIISQPLIISKIFIDVEDYTESVELSYCKPFDIYPKWYEINVPKEIISNKNKIISLAAYGIMVTTENAGKISEYLISLISDNAKYIPLVKGVSRMGYIYDEFVPYAESFKYIGDASYRNLYNSVKFHGSVEKWVDIYKSIENSIPAKIAVLASFASVLVPQIESFIYIFHIWGVSDIGKTLCLRLAASVWGKSDEYMQNLNATNVGLERTANFLHNMPLILDELQTIAEKKEFRDFIYKITQGQGKLRGSVEGVQRTSDWRNSVITTGEQPLTTQNSAGGEINRVFDIYCEKKIFDEPEKIYASITENYGWAGLYFIKALSCETFDFLDKFISWEQQKSLEFVDLKAKFEFWQAYIKNADGYNIDGKKKMCAALLLLADELVNTIFLGLNENDAQKKTYEFFSKLAQYIEPREDTDVIRRAYEYILAWVAENKSKFARKSADGENVVLNTQEEYMPEIWGKFETKETLFVSGKILKSTLDEGGFNYELTINELNRRGWTVKAENQVKSTKAARINGILVRGIELKLEI
jgi:hypothetical protein